MKENTVFKIHCSMSMQYNEKLYVQIYYQNTFSSEC
jgi:hypothetical protein